MKTEIRPVKIQDKARIEEISSKVWDGFDYVPNVFDKWLYDDGEFSVLLIDDEIVAFAKLTKLKENHLWLEGIRVDQDLKGNGYGNMIAEYQIELAKKMGFDKLELATFVDNVESLAIIEKRGFEKIISFKFYEIDFKNYDKDNIDSLAIDSQIRIVDDPSYIEKILESNSLKEQLNYINFDWTFIEADYELIKKIIDDKNLYIYESGGESNLFIYTDYMSKVNSRFISYIENSNGLSDILTYVIRRCIDENIDFLSYMSKVKTKFTKELELKKFTKYNDLVVDSYLYTYKG